ncbi:MAG: hypothetical protein RKP46_14520 [Candidatus Accumulibacter sp.]|uniref:hypothetical protein n=1 Tax=Accumulibacter sp. TaxID=2053492 RepID=UPI00287B5339|nr:hypothetical protein [Accumulibacter sp.]MDS4015543.1 hypothetical protein [Accumulibacter sp.]
MANLLGNKLNRIIREIAYAKGEVLTHKIAAEKAKDRIKLAAAELKAARSEMRLAEARVAALRPKLGEQADIAADEIRAIRHWPKLPTTSYGKIIKELVRYLQQDGEPKSTGEIVVHLVRKFGLPVGTNAERAETSSSIRKRLRKLVQQGVVARYPEETVLDGHSVAHWHWIGAPLK